MTHIDGESRRGLLRRDRDFRFFWAGISVSVVGTQVTAVALPLVAALTLGAGVGAVGTIAACSYLPNVFLPLIVGHWLEHRRRRPVMIWADVVRAAALALVPLSYALGFLSLPLLAAVAFAVGSASVVFDVGSFAYIPNLVDGADLPRANQAMQGSMTVAEVGGPGIAGVVVQALGPATAILVDVASYLGSVTGLLAVRRPEPVSDPADGTRSDLLGGVRQLLGNPYLRALTLHAALYNVASQVLMVNLVVWMVKDRGTGVGTYGLVLSMAGAGAFLGTMGVLRLSARVGYGRAYATTLVLFTGVPLVLAALPWRGNALGYAVAAVEVVAGLGLGGANVLSTTLRQTVVPRGSLARSVGSYRLLIYGVIPLGSALGGVLGESLGSRAGVALGTVGLVVSATPMARRRIRALGDPSEARVEVRPSATSSHM